MTRRESTIKNIVPNLRRRWPDELASFSDNQVAACYEDFSLSDDAGNNDERYFDVIGEYPR